MGGHRVGGPHKVPLKAPSDPSTQHLLQHMKLSDQQIAQLQQQQLWKQPSVLQSAGQPAVSGVTAAVSRSSSEATLHSSRTSSANSLDSAVAAAMDLTPGLPAELRPLQPASLAGFNSSSSKAVAAAPAAPAADSDSTMSEDPSLAASSGAGGQLGPTKRPDDHLLGYHHVKQWDILWTKSVYAIRAARQLQQGQIVSAIAGLNCLSMKKRMVQTLRMVSRLLLGVLVVSCSQGPGGVRVVLIGGGVSLC